MSLTVWKFFKKFKCGIYCWLFWISLKACNCLLHHYGMSRWVLITCEAKSSSLNIRVKEANSFFLIQFFSSKIKLWALERRFHLTCHCAWVTWTVLLRVNNMKKWMVHTFQILRNEISDKWFVIVCIQIVGCLYRMVIQAKT